MNCPYENQCHSSGYGTEWKYEDNERSCPQYIQTQPRLDKELLEKYQGSDLTTILKTIN